MRILKQFLVLLAAVFLAAGFCALPVPVQAAEGYVIDEVGILSQEDLSKLNAIAEEITNRQKCGVYVVITDDLNGYSESSYARGVFMNHDLGYGSGEGASGVLLAIAFKDSYFDSVAYGAASDTFNSTRLQSLNDVAYDRLAADDWYGACEDFLTTCDSMLTSSGYHYYVPQYTDPTIDPHIVITTPEQRRDAWLAKLPFSGIISAVISSITVLIMKGRNKNTRTASDADRYIIKNGVNITVSHDQFLNKTRSVTRIQRSSGGGGGGGSSGSSHSYHSSGFSSSGGGRHF